MKGLTPICPYCGTFSKLVTGLEIYPHRPDLGGLSFYQCAPCDAFVGVHKGTTRPLGRLADTELRKSKSAAHRAFDPLWELGNFKTRKDAYAWLAETLKIPVKECHIGEFDVHQCMRVIEACKKVSVIHHTHKILQVDVVAKDTPVGSSKVITTPLFNTTIVKVTKKF